MLRFLIQSAFCFLSRHRLLSLFFCLFSFVTMTTDSSHCCCILSLYDVCKKAFSLNFFFFSNSDSQKPKSLPCDTLMFLPTLRPFILESCCFWTKEMHIWILTNHFLLQNTSLSLQQLLPPLPHTHMHTTSSCTITPLHNCNRTPNYGQPLMKLVLLGKTKLPSLIS